MEKIVVNQPTKEALTVYQAIDTKLSGGMFTKDVRESGIIVTKPLDDSDVFNSKTRFVDVDNGSLLHGPANIDLTTKQVDDSKARWQTYRHTHDKLNKTITDAQIIRKGKIIPVRGKGELAAFTVATKQSIVVQRNLSLDQMVEQSEKETAQITKLRDAARVKLAEEEARKVELEKVAKAKAAKKAKATRAKK